MVRGGISQLPPGERVQQRVRRRVVRQVTVLGIRSCSKVTGIAVEDQENCTVKTPLLYTRAVGAHSESLSLANQLYSDDSERHTLRDAYTAPSASSQVPMTFMSLKGRHCDKIMFATPVVGSAIQNRLRTHALSLQSLTEETTYFASPAHYERY